MLKNCLWLFFLIFSVCSEGCNVQSKYIESKRYGELVAALGQIPVTGPIIGPAHGLSDNAATKAVVAEGPSIIPELTSALDHSTWKQSVWIVYCLRELHAKNAKDSILKLEHEEESNIRFENGQHDLTLYAEIQGFLKEVDQWQ